jgi:hypothetical protein
MGNLGKHILATVAAIGCRLRYTLMMLAIIILGACSNSPVSVEECLDDANASIADANWSQAQASCDHLLTLVIGVDSGVVTDTQAARLSIMFMKLSEHQREDENVADAMQCLRYALRISPDSLTKFSTTLPLEDERHFELLRHIDLSLDNPVDISDETDIPEEYEE